MSTSTAVNLRTLVITAIKVMACYLAVALAYMAFEAIHASPFVKMQSKRLAWQVSAYSTFPFPLEPEDFDSNYFLNRSAKSLLSDLAVMMAVVGGTHLITFSITAILHRRRSVPNYWRDLEPPPDATRMLLRSAQWGSWAFLLTTISQMVGRFELDCAYYGATFPFTGNMSVVAALAVTILVLMAVSSRAVKRVVLARLTPDDRRCLNCAQSLRVTTADRCPECGRPFDPRAKLDYRLRWGPVSFLMTRKWIVVVCVCLVILVAPFGVTRLIRQLPRHVQDRVASHVIGPLGSFRSSNKSYPIRLDSVCVFRQKNEIAIVRFEYVRPGFARYRTLYWRGETLVGRTPADQEISGELDAPSYDALTIGPWRFSAQSDGCRMVWLYCRTAGLDVKSYLMKDVPAEYRAAVESMMGGSR